MRHAPAILLSCTFFAFGACTMGSSIANGKATIVPPALEPGDVAPLSGGAPVAVVAGAAKDEWYVLSSKDEDRTQANLAVWSGQAAAGLARDLAAIGGKVDAGAPKRVEVTVTGVLGEIGFAKAGVTVTLQVRTGDGTTAMFSQQAASMRGLIFCSEQAMRAAIQEALNDERVRRYLQS